jgi:hypothetical protein
MNLHWPKTPSNGYAPWYAIALRLLLWLPMQAGRGVFVVCVLIGWDYDMACNMWEQTR